MGMGLRQYLVVAALFALLIGISAWLRFGLLAPADGAAPAVGGENEGVDYYIENFVSTGMDRRGKKYRLSAARLLHYPGDERALLQRPHLIQYHPPRAPRHIHADSGWLGDDGAQLLLSGNVRVIEVGGARATTNTMRIRLKGAGAGARSGDGG